jgi:DNA polymerase elongation subunit (family B)
MRGWIFDTYPDYQKDHMVSWIKTEDGIEKLVDRKFLPTFYVHGSRKNLLNLADVVSTHKLRDLSFERKKIKLGYDGKFEVLAVTPYRYKDVKLLAKMIDAQGGYRDFQLYNVDIRLAQRYLVERGVFPMAYVDVGNEFILLDEQWAMEYPLPEMTHTEIGVKVKSASGIKRFNDPIQAIKVGERVFEGDEIDILRNMVKEIKSTDPDVVYTKDGDSFLFPYLYNRADANGILDEIQLGRERQTHRPDRAGRSFFRYGRVEYKPPLYTLRGRLHVDTHNSFLHMESGLKGLIELSRISCIPVQTLAKLSPGTAISAMQVNQAMRDGHVVTWKKNLPEDFKTAKELMVTDRGGFIYEPVVGIHSKVLELDFTSLYPSIMVRFNISPETLKCPCCPDSRRRVPEIGYNICEKQVGLIAKVLKPVIQRRMVYKKRGKEGDLEYKERSDILKWLLVTCLDGSTVVPYKINGLYGIGSVESVIDRYLPDRHGIVSPEDDLRVFGFDDGLHPVEKRVLHVMKSPSPESLLRIRLTGGREILATPNHRFFILSNDDSLVVKRGDELKLKDRIPLIPHLPLKANPVGSVNLAEVLLQKLPESELPMWRVRGGSLEDGIEEAYKQILKVARKDGYAYRTIWLWKKHGYLPLKFLRFLSLPQEDLDRLEIGRGRRGGGSIAYLPAKMPIDEDLGFLLGFFIGDGNGKANMVRFGIGLDDSEIVVKLKNVVLDKFKLDGRVRKEKHANMWVLQFNSIALKRILEVVFGIGSSVKKGKLVIPQIVLNSSENVRFAFLGGLIASDGYVHDSGDWSFICSANREFIESIGLLLSTLGIRSSVRYSAPHGYPLYAIDFRSTDVRGKTWFKDFHKTRIHSIDASQKKTSEVDKSHNYLETKSIEEVPALTEHVYCFEVEGNPSAFVIDGGLVTGNSFGYTGYKNARYGRIECHESITAYGREIMLRSAEIAERHGYRVLHGIVDSLWLEGNGNHNAVAEHLRNDIGIPVEMEGVYKWIVFLPCKSIDVGAMNRYYGLFESGEMKVRGVELRRSDSPQIVKKAQQEMLDILSKAEDSDEFKEMIPEALGSLKVWAERVMYGDVDIEDLIFTSRVSKPLEEYAHFSNQVAALAQLQEHMVDVNPGEIVRYLLVNSESMKASERLKIADLVEDGDEYDKKKYVEHLFKAGESLFQPFGYNLERIEEEYGV